MMNKVELPGDIYPPMYRTLWACLYVHYQLENLRIEIRTVEKDIMVFKATQGWGHLCHPRYMYKTLYRLAIQKGVKVNKVKKGRKTPLRIEIREWAFTPAPGAFYEVEINGHPIDRFYDDLRFSDFHTLGYIRYNRPNDRACYCGRELTKQERAKMFIMGVGDE